MIVGTITYLPANLTVVGFLPSVNPFMVSFCTRTGKLLLQIIENAYFLKSEAPLFQQHCTRCRTISAPVSIIISIGSTIIRRVPRYGPGNDAQVRQEWCYEIGFIRSIADGNKIVRRWSLKPQRCEESKFRFCYNSRNQCARENCRKEKLHAYIVITYVIFFFRKLTN